MFELKVAAPLVPVVVKVNPLATIADGIILTLTPLPIIAPVPPVIVKCAVLELVILPIVKADCLPLNVDQSALDNAPLFEALAVGTFKVITGVVVLVATVELKSVPLVPSVKAATLVTVPTNWSAYCGMFNTPVVLLYVDAPLVPVVVKEIANLALESVK